MKIAVVFPHFGYASGRRPHLNAKDTYHIPQSLNYLYSISREFAGEVRVYDYNFEDKLNALSKFNPDIILVSSSTPAFENAQKVIEYVSKRLKKAKIYIGGPHVNSNYKARPNFIKTKATPVAINKNIFFWTKKVFGKNVNYDFSDFVPNSDWIGKTYPKSLIKEIRLSIITSLGCTHSCRFCLNPLIYNREFKKPAVVRKEVEQLVKLYNPSKITIPDVYFLMNMRHAKKVMDLMKEYKLKWSTQTCLESLTDKNLVLMGKSGCTGVLTGIENFYSREFEKPIKKQFLESRIRLAQKLGIKLSLSFMVGLVDTNFKQDKLMIEYIKQLINKYNLSYRQIQCNIFTPYLPDRRVELVPVPLRFWGLFPVNKGRKESLEEKIKLIDLVYEKLYLKFLKPYKKVRKEYLSFVKRIIFEKDTS